MRVETFVKTIGNQGKNCYQTLNRGLPYRDTYIFYIAFTSKFYRRKRFSIENKISNLCMRIFMIQNLHLLTSDPVAIDICCLYSYRYKMWKLFEATIISSVFLLWKVARMLHRIAKLFENKYDNNTIIFEAGKTRLELTRFKKRLMRKLNDNFTSQQTVR